MTGLAHEGKQTSKAAVPPLPQKAAAAPQHHPGAGPAPAPPQCSWPRADGSEGNLRLVSVGTTHPFLCNGEGGFALSYLHGNPLGTMEPDWAYAEIQI